MYKCLDMTRSHPKKVLPLLCRITLRRKHDWSNESQTARKGRDVDSPSKVRNKQRCQDWSLPANETNRELESRESDSEEPDSEGRDLPMQQLQTRIEKREKRNQSPRLKDITHIYRAILRAVTYLPDEFARQYMRDHIVQRFRHNSKKSPPSSKIMKNRIKKAEHACHTLQHANFRTENRGALEDILERVYGRKGTRRRLLLKDIFAKDEEEVPKDDKALQELITNPAGHQATNYEPGSKFYQFLVSQQAHQPLDYRSAIRKLQPNIPETNIWLRPMPKKAQLGLRRRWWAMTLDKLAPPVSLAEWERLKGFSTGERKFDVVPSRRSNGLHSSFPLHTETSTHEEREKKENLRSIQRLYASIWLKTPTMKQDELSKKWEITWGGHRSAYHNGEVSQPSKAQEEFFEGLEDQTAVRILSSREKKGRGNLGRKSDV